VAVRPKQFHESKNASSPKLCWNFVIEKGMQANFENVRDQMQIYDLTLRIRKWARKSERGEMWKGGKENNILNVNEYPEV